MDLITLYPLKYIFRKNEYKILKVVIMVKRKIIKEKFIMTDKKISILEKENIINIIKLEGKKYLEKDQIKNIEIALELEKRRI